MLRAAERELRRLELGGPEKTSTSAPARGGESGEASLLSPEEDLLDDVQLQQAAFREWYVAQQAAQTAQWTSEVRQLGDSIAELRAAPGPTEFIGSLVMSLCLKVVAVVAASLSAAEGSVIAAGVSAVTGGAATFLDGLLAQKGLRKYCACPRWAKVSPASSSTCRKIC